MLVFDDSIENLENTRKFWIKNTISTVKAKKLTSKNDTNLENKIINNQKTNIESNYDKNRYNDKNKYDKNKFDKNRYNDKNKYDKNRYNDRNKYDKNCCNDRKNYNFQSKKNLNKISYNDKSTNQNGKKQTKKTKKIRRFN